MSENKKVINVEDRESALALRWLQFATSDVTYAKAFAGIHREGDRTVTADAGRVHIATIPEPLEDMPDGDVWSLNENVYKTVPRDYDVSPLDGKFPSIECVYAEEREETTYKYEYRIRVGHLREALEFPAGDSEYITVGIHVVEQEENYGYLVLRYKDFEAHLILKEV